MRTRGVNGEAAEASAMRGKFQIFQFLIKLRLEKCLEVVFVACSEVAEAKNIVVRGVHDQLS